MSGIHQLKSYIHMRILYNIFEFELTAILYNLAKKKAKIISIKNLESIDKKLSTSQLV